MELSRLGLTMHATTTRHLTTAALLCALALIAPVQLHADSMTSASVLVPSSDSICVTGQPGSHQGIFLSAYGMSTPSCTGSAAAGTGNGTLSVISGASTIHAEPQPPGYPERTPIVVARSSASISEQVNLFLTDSTYLASLGDTWIINTNFIASGTVDGGASDIILLWNSIINYQVSFGGETLSGSKSNIGSRSGQNRIIQDSEDNWGVQSLTFVWKPSEGFSLNFAMSASSFAEATASGSGSPLGATAFAEADFSHTLRWLGVSSVSGFRANGDAIDLGRDFELNMIGEDSGFNYRFAAPTSVPEPAEWMTLLTGLALMGTVMHRRAKSLSVNRRMNR